MRVSSFTSNPLLTGAARIAASLQGGAAGSQPQPQEAFRMNDIVRRDPRAEWIARNRLHPLHAAMQSAQGGEVRWMGPTA